MSASIDYDADGYPIFPLNEKGMPVLPKDSRDQPFFPLDDHELPIFPFDKVKKRWTFPVDDTEEPIFPRNAFNKPIVPVDENDCPIFPVDDKGEFIFPLDESNCPIPALRPDGQPVIPKDEYGNFVIPKDRKGKPLIHIADDGVTPMSLTDWKQWKQYCRANKAYLHEVQQQQQMQAAQQQHQAAANYTASGVQMSMIFHPLNLEQNAMSRANELAMLQRTKRVRPEDIDLPMPGAVDMSMDSSMVEMAGYYDYYGTDGGAGGVMDDGYAAYTNGGGATNGMESAMASNATTEADPLKERALKRKKFLAAQLNFSKKLPVRQAEREQKLGNSECGNSKVSATKLSEPSVTLGKNIKQEKDSVDDHPVDDGQFYKQTPKANDMKMETSEAFLSNSDKRQNDDSIRTIADSKENISSKVECLEDGRKKTELNFATTKTDNSSLAKEINERSHLRHSKEKKHSSSSKREKHRHRSRHHSSRSRHGSCDDDNGEQPDVKRRRASKSCFSNNASSFDATDYSEYDIRSLNENSELKMVRRCIKHTRRKYDSIKEQIAALEEQRAVQRQKLKRLFKVESLVEKRLGIEYLSSSASPEASGGNGSSESSSSDEESDYRGGRSK